MNMAAALNSELLNGIPEETGQGATIPHRKIRKAIIESDPEDDAPPAKREKDEFSTLHSDSGVATYDMDTDISQLEAPTFTTLDRGPSQKMMELSWDHKVDLGGKKVVNPMIHNCDKCNKPILIYGRMIPCKHVFCFKCAQAERTQCPRCKDKVSRVEQAGLGSIYMCSHGGSQYGSGGCRRTYLSQRDLQAHVHHRHVKQQSGSKQKTTATEAKSSALPPQGVPSTADIAAATAALVADRKKYDASAYRHADQPSHRTVAAGGGGGGVSGFDSSRAASVAYASSNLPAASQHYSSQPPPASSHHHPHRAHGVSVAGSAMTAQRNCQQQSNLITVPILDTGASGPLSSAGRWAAETRTFTQPPPNYYPPPTANSGGGEPMYQYQTAGLSNSSNYGSSGQWQSSGGGRTSAQMGASGYYRR